MKEYDGFGCTYTEWREQVKPFEEVLLANKDIVVELPYQVDDTVTAIRTVPVLNEKYVCPYCGTVYYVTDGGFVPGCQNCGGTLRFEED